MFDTFTRFILISMLLTFIFTESISAKDENAPLAKSDFFTITQDDISLLRSRMRSFFETTQTEYCRALLKIKLFARQAREKQIDIEPEIAAELNQMIEQKLSDIYINRLLSEYELLAGSVEAYYHSHPDEFTTADGTPVPLNDAVRKNIRQNILKQKKSEVANKELARLMEKYKVEIIDPVCTPRKQTNE